VKVFVALARRSLQPPKQQDLIARLWIASDSIAPEPEARNAANLMSVTNAFPANATATDRMDDLGAATQHPSFHCEPDARTANAQFHALPNPHKFMER
jgi:hypothetical protein